MAGVVTSITAVMDVSATGSQVRLLSIKDRSMTPPDARRRPVQLKRRGGWIRGRAEGTMSTPLDAQQRQMISDSAQKVRCQCRRHHVQEAPVQRPASEASPYKHLPDDSIAKNP
jgi:hypothetical protein